MQVVAVQSIAQAGSMGELTLFWESGKSLTVSKL
jgi:hypothetical protein